MTCSLLLGIVATWLVSWACSIVLETDRWDSILMKEPLPDDDYDSWGVGMSTRPGLTVWFASRRGRRDLLAIDAPQWAGVSLGDGIALLERGCLSKTVEATGWPCLSMYCVRIKWRGTDPDSVIGGIDYSPRANRVYPFPYDPMLPLTPLWSGFAINTLVYGGFFWLSVTGIVAMRVGYRFRQRLCRKCAYDVRGLAHVCPECGLPIPASASWSERLGGEVAALLLTGWRIMRSNLLLLLIRKRRSEGISRILGRVIIVAALLVGLYFLAQNLLDSSIRRSDESRRELWRQHQQKVAEQSDTEERPQGED